MPFMYAAPTAPSRAGDSEAAGKRIEKDCDKWTAARNGAGLLELICTAAHYAPSGCTYCCDSILHLILCVPPQHKKRTVLPRSISAQARIRKIRTYAVSKYKDFAKFIAAGK